MQQRTVGDIVETLKDSRARGKGCALLIGAGCSVTAGIPTANQFVSIIQREYPQALARAQARTYPHCMAELTSGQRRELISRYVDNAKINWGHICIARLVQEGYVTRVLTVNFDPLVVRACAMLGEHPAVYDLATSNCFKAAYLPKKAVFHLHGQHTGFVLLNTEEEMRRHARRLGNVFEEAGNGRPWIVVGYSGESDPVFERLVQAEFDYGLFWVAYLDQSPAAVVMHKLLDRRRGAFLTRGHDSDSFFVKLAQGLGVFPPDIVHRPFTHMARTLEMLTSSYSIPHESSGINVLDIPRKWILSAIDLLEGGSFSGEAQHMMPPSETALAAEAQRLLMAGHYEQIIEMPQSPDLAGQEAVSDVLFWAYMAQGDSLSDQARSANGSDVGALLTRACESYSKAHKGWPHRPEPLYNWGAALLDQAKSMTGDGADGGYLAAISKFEAALELNPTLHQAQNNWGVALLGRAKLKAGDEAARLCEQAAERFQAALAIKPDKSHSFFNWGNALRERAYLKSGKDATRLRHEAVQRYKAALDLSPQMAEALYNWGLTLTALAEGEEDKREADRLYDLAAEKYRQVYSMQPDNAGVLVDWGNTLNSQAKLGTNAVAAELFASAHQKYVEALTIKPSHHPAFFFWAKSLDEQAAMMTGSESDRLLSEACVKFEAALSINPDQPDALDGLGNALLHRAERHKGDKAEEFYRAAQAQYQRALSLKPDRHETMYNWGVLLLSQARTADGAQAQALLSLAACKFESASELHPGMHMAFYNWGIALTRLAAFRDGIEADRLYSQAAQKYDLALKAKPESAECLYNWGLVLYRQANLRVGYEAAALYTQACEKYQRAHVLAPERGDILNNWGVALACMAGATEGSAALECYGEAIRRLSDALSRQPDNPQVHRNLGLAYLGQARVMSARGELADQALNAARGYLNKAEGRDPGSAAYDLACVDALAANAEGCLEWLRRCRALGVLPPASVLMTERDFAPFRNNDWFGRLAYGDPKTQP